MDPEDRVRVLKALCELRLDVSIRTGVPRGTLEADASVCLYGGEAQGGIRFEGVCSKMTSEGGSNHPQKASEQKHSDSNQSEKTRGDGFIGMAILALLNIWPEGWLPS